MMSCMICCVNTIIVLSVVSKTCFFGVGKKLIGEIRVTDDIHYEWWNRSC